MSQYQSNKYRSYTDPINMDGRRAFATTLLRDLQAIQEDQNYCDEMSVSGLAEWLHALYEKLRDGAGEGKGKDGTPTKDLVAVLEQSPSGPLVLERLLVMLHGSFASVLEAMSDADQAGAEEPAMAALDVLISECRLLGIQEYAEEAAIAATLGKVQEHVAALAEEDASGGWLSEAMSCISGVPHVFLSHTLKSTEDMSCTMWQHRLQYFVYEKAGLLLSSLLFDLIVDYPDSLPSLRDLYTCLENTNLYDRVAADFLASVRKRLLHPGATTSDILQQYIFAIRAMKHIDPTDATLAPARAAIQDYLQTRRDAIRCVVLLLTGDGENEAAGMLEELEQDAVAVSVKADHRPCFEGPGADLAALEEADRWAPAPRQVYGLAAQSDVVGQLTEIWGSKDLFAAEYRRMLAERLLAKVDYDCDRELRTLELLKLRFGDVVLLPAEIMLKDLTDSKRINSQIQARLRPGGTEAPPGGCPAVIPTACMLSELFWPPEMVERDVGLEQLQLPADVASGLEAYSDAYHRIKAPRKLHWLTTRGRVELELRIGESTLSVVVDPAHASVVLAFRDRPSMTAKELSQALGGVAIGVADRLARFWVRRGVLLQQGPAGTDISAASATAPVYTRASTLHGSLGDPAAGTSIEEESEGAAADSACDPGMRTMMPYEPFVLGMLTNFSSLPLDRIHNMLKMFVSEPPYDRSPDELSAFLLHLVGQGKLENEGGGTFRRASAA